MAIYCATYVKYSTSLLTANEESATVRNDSSSYLCYVCLCTQLLYMGKCECRIHSYVRMHVRMWGRLQLVLFSFVCGM